MSLLDEDYIDKINDAALPAVQKQLANQPVKYCFCTVQQVMQYMAKIQNFLYEHCVQANSRFQMMHIKDCLNSTILADSTILAGSNSEEFKKIFKMLRSTKHLAELGLTCSEIIPIPHKHMPYYYQIYTIAKKIPHRNLQSTDTHCSPVSNTSETQYYLDTQSTLVKLPMPVITISIEPRAIIPERYSLTYSPNNVIILQNVTELPDWFCTKVGENMYKWAVPINKIYFYNCSNIPQEILDLPYVYVLENDIKFH